MEEDELTKFAREMEEQAQDGFSYAVVDHAMNPRNLGKLEDATGEARYKGPCGDTMVIWLDIDGDLIERAHFWTDGCGSSIACGSMTTVLASGKTVEEALEITQQDVLEALDGLPPENEHCALLAARTLKLAIKDFRDRTGGDKR